MKIHKDLCQPLALGHFSISKNTCRSVEHLYILGNNELKLTCKISKYSQ